MFGFGKSLRKELPAFCRFLRIDRFLLGFVHLRSLLLLYVGIESMYPSS
jgi:hypothetical protein